MKKIKLLRFNWVAVLLISMLISLASTTSVFPSEKVSLDVIIINYGPAIRMFKEEFEKKYPDIDLTLAGKPWPSIYKDIQVTMVAGGPKPDCIIVDPPYFAPYQFRGWLRPLDDVIDPERLKDIYPWSLEAARYQGKLYALPHVLAVSAWYYNKDMFDAVGLAYLPAAPESPTWEYIVEAAKKLVKKDASGQVVTWGMIIDQEDRPYEVLPLIGSLGGQYVGKDGLTVRGIMNSQPWKDAYSWYVDLYRKWRVSPNTKHPWAPDMFLGGQLAQMEIGPWSLPYLWEREPEFPWGMTGVPHFEKGNPMVTIGGWFWGINPRTDNLDAAVKWLHFISDPEIEWKWYHDYAGDFAASTTVHRRLMKDVKYQEWPFSAAREIVRIADSGYTVPFPTTPAYFEYEDIFIRESSNMRQGKDIDAALKDMENSIEIEMERYREAIEARER